MPTRPTTTATSADRRTTVGADFASEQPHLLSLPADRFDTARSLTARVDQKARISGCGSATTGVPARLAGWTLDRAPGREVLEVRAGGRVVARHERPGTRGSQSLVLDHYLEVLVGKPGALPNATALAQAREQGAFTQAHEAFWRVARRKLGDGPGTRALTWGAAGPPAPACRRGHPWGSTGRPLAGSVNPEVVLARGPPSR